MEQTNKAEILKVAKHAQCLKKNRTCKRVEKEQQQQLVVFLCLCSKLLANKKHLKLNSNVKNFM